MWTVPKPKAETVRLGDDPKGKLDLEMLILEQKVSSSKTVYKNQSRLGALVLKQKWWTVLKDDTVVLVTGGFDPYTQWSYTNVFPKQNN